jgi:hypothetical protein
MFGRPTASKANSIQGKANTIQGKGKADSVQGKADSIQGTGKANSIQGKADYTANIIQGKSGYLHGSVGGLNVVIDPVGEFAVAASQATASQLSSIIPVVQLGKFAAQSSSDIVYDLAHLAAGALEAFDDSQCPTDAEIDSTVSCVAVASEATQAPDWGDMDSQAL